MIIAVGAGQRQEILSRFEYGSDLLIRGQTEGKGSLTGLFQPGAAIASLQLEKPQAGAVILFGMLRPFKDNLDELFGPTSPAQSLTEIRQQEKNNIAITIG